MREERVRIMMRADWINYGLAKPGTMEDFPFGPEPSVLKVCGRMFALLSGEGDSLSLSVKCDPFLAELLREQYDAVTPGYHMNKRHWNTVRMDGSVPDDEVRDMIDQSYALVVKKLSKAEQAALAEVN